jgi:ADP-ribose pyrophosphatase YjhB (NUDIX family)
MDKFCKFCGTKHSAEEYPKQCNHCSHISYINPTPVAVLLQPIVDGDNVGIVIGERGIDPMKGHYGLPGGFIDPKDKNVIDAARREFREEIGFEAPDESKMILFDSYSDSKNLLIFVRSFHVLPLSALDAFVPNYECPAIRVAWEPEQLCFNSHTNALAEYFRLRGGKGPSELWPKPWEK